MISRTCRALLLCSPAFLFLGCGGSTTQPTGSVSGKVTYNMKPVGDANINFMSSGGNGAGQVAKAGSDGTFKMANPMPSGSYKVYITALTPGAPTPGSTPTPITPPAVPAAAMTLETTKLTAEVKPGSNTLDLVVTDGQTLVKVDRDLKLSETEGNGVKLTGTDRKHTAVLFYLTSTSSDKPTTSQLTRIDLSQLLLTVFTGPFIVPALAGFLSIAGLVCAWIITEVPSIRVLSDRTFPKSFLFILNNPVITNGYAGLRV